MNQYRLYNSLPKQTGVGGFFILLLQGWKRYQDLHFSLPMYHMLFLIPLFSVHYFTETYLPKQYFTWHIFLSSIVKSCILLTIIYLNYNTPNIFPVCIIILHQFVLHLVSVLSICFGFSPNFDTFVANVTAIAKTHLNI